MISNATRFIDLDYAPMKNSSFTPQLTKDGSYTFFSTEFQEAFHSAFGAKQEAEVRYIEPCLLKQLAAKRSTIRILDICYGLGYNSAAALEAIWSVNPNCKVELQALEISADVPRQAVANNLLDLWQPSVHRRLAQLSIKSLIHDEKLKARLLLRDARKSIKEIAKRNWKADAVFLDPFSPPKCPQLWTIEFIDLVTQCLAEKGRLATYSASAAVRTSLIMANLSIISVTGAGRKSPGTIALKKYKSILVLSQKELEHLKTRAAIPYRDPNLGDLSKTIILRRREEQKLSNLESTSQWRKRWF